MSATQDYRDLFVGLDAGRVNAVSGAEGVYNTFIGSNAGYSMTSGNSMVLIGHG